jgi:hypothetical protein
MPTFDAPALLSLAIIIAYRSAERQNGLSRCATSVVAAEGRGESNGATVGFCPA